MKTLATPLGHRTLSQTRVRYAETDQMGVVYHSNYLIWCEIGRTDYLRELGATYADLERDGLRLAVAEAQVRYLAPARYDDLIEVVTWLDRVQSRVLTFKYEIFRSDPGPRQLLVTASTRLIATAANGGLCTIPTNLMELFRDAMAPT